jgi:hypothetical protein
MQLSGFNLSDYERILDIGLDAGYRFYTLADYLESDSVDEPHIVLRHDVDRRVGNALALASTEADRDVTSTYYFRTNTFSPDVARRIESMGHEVGYHYEDLAKTRGDVEEAHRRFGTNLDSFREHVDVRTACAHGSPLSPHLNTEMWKDARTTADYGLLGEAYSALEFDSRGESDLLYLSDTGRDWDATASDFGAVRSTDDVVGALESRACSSLYVLAHPSRWAVSPVQTIERPCWDIAAEAAKATASGAHSVQRASGRIAEGTRAARAIQSVVTRVSQE